MDCYAALAAPLIPTAAGAGVKAGIEWAETERAVLFWEVAGVMLAVDPSRTYPPTAFLRAWISLLFSGWLRTATLMKSWPRPND
ncbi:MAG: hypothetical protein A4E45_01804 [Methanosaeta sp. PtaB.Bin039]|nr:MAG: hypothetical protein A4E45_01804 [Methanosaeta sp. PtaB.Bin039]